MKVNLKLTTLNEKGIEKIEVEKLQNIKGGRSPFTCENESGKCTRDHVYYDSFHK